MISVPSARHKYLLLPPRTEPTPLDQERSFLLRIVGRSMEKGVALEGKVPPSSEKEK